MLTEHLRLLADETRLRIMHLLASEPLTVAEIQEVIDVSQSSVSGHLAKLKRASFLHDQAEGSAHRYRLREDMPSSAGTSWNAISAISAKEPMVVNDAERLADLRRNQGRSWVDRVAGTLHRAYAPGRTFDTLFHGFSYCLNLGTCVDIGAGDGALLEVLAPRCDELICVDPSPMMIKAGQQRAAELNLDNVRYVESSGEEIPIADQTADHVLFIQSLQYIADPEAAINHGLHILKPGGRILIMTLASHRFPEAERYGHVHRGFNEEQIASWLNTCADVELTTLPAENRAPRFQSLIASGRKI